MNIDFQKLFLRGIPLFCCLVLVVATFPVSVSAVTDGFLDYNDYITDIQVDGDKDLVTVTIPVDKSQIIVFENGTVVTGSNSGSLSVSLKAGSEQSYEFSFFGNRPDLPISFENIPNGSTVKMTIQAEYANVQHGFVTPGVVMGVYQYDASLATISSERFSLGAWDYATPQTTSFVLNKASGASGFSCFMVLSPIQFFVAEPTLTLKLSPMVIEMSISSLYRLQEETGKTNELLQLVLQKLDQIEQENLNWFERILKAIEDGFMALMDAFDGLLGITAEDKQAAEDFKNDAIDKSEKLEGAVDAMGSVNKPPSGQVQAGMDSVLPSDGGNYVSQTMNVIVGYPLVAEQLSIVVIIMFASFVLFGKKEA